MNELNGMDAEEGTTLEQAKRELPSTLPRLVSSRTWI